MHFLLFIQAYGLYTERPNRFMDMYGWSAHSVKLDLTYEKAGQQGFAMYTFKPFQEQIDRRKNTALKKEADKL